MASYTGTVKWFDTNKGYGFISCNNGDDVFAHYSQVKEKGNDKNLHEGQNVTFDIQKSDKGQSAFNIQKLDWLSIL